MILRRAKFKQVCEPVQIHKQATIQTTLPLPLNNFSFLWSFFFFFCYLMEGFLLQHLRKNKKFKDYFVGPLVVWVN